MPALVSEEMFALAQEQLERNKRHSPRATITLSKVACWRSSCRRAAMHYMGGTFFN